MTEVLTYSMNMAIGSGPSFSLTGTENVEAYDIVDVLVLKTEGEVTVDVQPSGVGLVTKLFMKSDVYSVDGSLTFQVDTQEIAPPMVEGETAKSEKRKARFDKDRRGDAE